ncbi:MAG TPA: VTT domain-containing protein [Candidatus Sulfotelmatobacter sp.]|jgi:membrane protein YqaA with SNARE-associated domain|nr:VTT domain-containing protein [Candidatus Sulfotelmatobacter sp.]
MLHLLFQAPRRRVRSGTVTSTLLHLGAVGLFFLAILDSSPLPTFGGLDILTAVLAASRRNPWYEYGATASAGSVVGAYLTFRLAHRAGEAYVEKKFKKGTVSRFLKLFKKWGTGTLVASTAIPFPTPTSMFFAAAGASDYPLPKFLIVVTLCRAVRYFGIAFIAGQYGRGFIHVLRHPLQHWGWLTVALALIAVSITGGILINRRLQSAPAQ